ncbi:MAG: flagellar motor protein MotB [Proteobacteria bacterium]|nr:flagellar motor protein MotB [Pseudomonadota bacterium]MBU4037157.1 flagellar motor protein MotB [Pseudomonadota bacterium]
MDKEIKKANTLKTRRADSTLWEYNQQQPETPEDYYNGLPSEDEMQLYTRMREPQRGGWSVVWSDLMMTMFILFAVMYVYQASKHNFSFVEQVEANAVPATVAETMPPPKMQMSIESVNTSSSHKQEKNTDTMRLQNLSDIGKVELQEDKAVRIVLPGDLLFDAGRADLKQSSLNTLKEVAEAIRINDYRVNVVGFTDNVPMHSEKYATNWELSAIRACTVTRFLIEQMNLSESRFYVSGYANLEPVAPNDTPENRAANRRVELVLTKKRPKAENNSHI